MGATSVTAREWVGRALVACGGIVCLVLTGGAAGGPVVSADMPSVEVACLGRGAEARQVRRVMDRRLRGRLDRFLWGRGPWDWGFTEGSPEYESFRKRPPEPASLVVRDRTGKVTQRIRIPVPLVRIVPWGPGRNGCFDRVFLSEDHSTGAGTHTGIRTFVLRLDHGQVVKDQVVEADGRRQMLELDQTPMDAWQAFPWPGDILVVSCDTAFNADSATTHFVTTYERLLYREGVWHRRFRQRDVYWEPPFPDSTLFP